MFMTCGSNITEEVLEPFNGSLLAVPLDNVRFTQFESQTHHIVFAWAMRMSGNADDANDLVQETYLRLYTAARRGLDNTTNIAGYCRIILRHCWDDELRRRRRMPSEESLGKDEDSVSAADNLADLKPLAEAGIAAQENIKVLRDCLRKLPRRYRDPIYCHDLERMSIDETANRLGIKESCVKMRLFRGRKMLKKKLLKAGIDGT